MSTGIDYFGSVFGMNNSTDDSLSTEDLRNFFSATFVQSATVISGVPGLTPAVIDYDGPVTWESISGLALTVDIGESFRYFLYGENLPSPDDLQGKSLSDLVDLYGDLQLRGIWSWRGDALIRGIEVSEGGTPVGLESWPDFSLEGSVSQAFYSGNDYFFGNDDLTLTFPDLESPNVDLVYGWGGNDVFEGRLGNDKFIGGTGVDYILFESGYKNFSVTQQGVVDPVSGLSSFGWQFQDLVGNEGTDQTIGVEYALFSDVTVGLEINGVAGKAYRIYKAAFDRDPMDGDTQGLGYWISKMSQGMDLQEVSARFIDSDEFRDLYGARPTSGEFLTKVYNNVLDRDPDAEGYAWWIDQLENNPEKTWDKVLADFSESPENQENVAALIATGIVFDYWAG